MSLASPATTKAALAVAAFAVAYKATSRYLAASDEDGHADRDDDAETNLLAQALAGALRARAAADAAEKRAEEAEARSSSLEVVAANCAAFRAAADSARRWRHRRPRKAWRAPVSLFDAIAAARPCAYRRRPRTRAS